MHNCVVAFWYDKKLGEMGNLVRKNDLQKYVKEGLHKSEFFRWFSYCPFCKKPVEVVK